MLFCACNQMNPAFSQVFTIAADDNELEEYNDAGSPYIDMPFLENGYDWFQYITVDVSKYDRRTAKKVGINYLPQDGSLADEHVNDHMAFMKPKRLPTDHNYAMTYRELETDRIAISITINEWLKQFIVYCAVQVGVTYPERPLRTWNDFMDYIDRFMKTRDDAMLVLKALVFSFDYVPDFRKKITMGVLVQHNLTIVKKPKETRRDFCEKMVTHRHNMIRKQINEACEPKTGFHFRVIRPAGSSGLEERVPKYFSDWMLTHDPTKIGVPAACTTKNKKKKKPKKITRRNKPCYDTNKNEVRTPAEIMKDLADIDQNKKDLLAELEVANSKPPADITVRDDDSDGLADDDDEDDDGPPTFQTQTLTQIYPKGGSKIDQTPNPRSSPRLKKNSPLLGQYSELDDDPKTDEDDVIFIDKKKSKRNSPQSLRRNSNSKDDDCDTSTVDENTIGSSRKRKGSSIKSKSGSRSGSKRKKKHEDSVAEMNDEIFEKMKRQLYKSIQKKRSKQRNNHTDSDDDSKEDKKRSEKKKKSSGKKKKKSRSSSSDDDSSSSSDESDSDSDSDSSSTHKKSSSKKNRKKKTDSEDDEKETKSSSKKKPPSTKKAPVITKKAITQNNNKSSAIVLKEKRDVKEKNKQTLTQMFPKTKPKPKPNLKIVVEPEECQYDIPCYPQLPSENVKGDKSLRGTKNHPLNILNLRKGTGWKLEFFVRWANNCCEWIFIHGIIYKLQEEVEHFMTTYNLDWATCGYCIDPRLTTRKQRHYCDFEPLESTKLKPIAGAKRDPIDFPALTRDIYAKFQLNTRFISDPTSGIIDILTTPTKKKNEDAFFWNNVANVPNVTNDVSVSNADDESEDSNEIDNVNGDNHDDEDITNEGKEEN